MDSNDIKPKFYPTTVLSRRLDVLSELNPSLKVDEALFEMLWALESCYEAIEVFDGEFIQCPVCYKSADQDGVIYHKMPEDLLN